jgi:hypothetical protein
MTGNFDCAQSLKRFRGLSLAEARIRKTFHLY